MGEVDGGQNKTRKLMCWGYITDIGGSLDSDAGINESLEVCEKNNDMVH